MIIIYFFFSVLISGSDNQVELDKLNVLEEKIFQNEKSIKKNKNKIACNLAFQFQNINEYEKSKKYLPYCKKLGLNYRELHDFMDIRIKFHFNYKNLVGKINYFLKKYDKSVFIKDVEKIKLRYYFKNKNYRSSYYGYLKYKKDNDVSHEELIFINYIIRYSYLKIAQKDDKFIAMLDILQDKKFYTKEEIDVILEEVNKYTLSDVKVFIKSYLKEKKYYKIASLLYLTRVFLPLMFKEIISDEEIKKLLNIEQTLLNYQINIYHYNAKNWRFEKKEEFLDKLLENTKKEKELNDILYQKLVLYKNYNKLEKRVKTYKKVLELKQPRRKQAYYYLKIGVYSIDLDNEEEGIKYLNIVLDKFNRWYNEYPSAIFTLFKIYRSKYLNEKDEKLKKKHLLSLSNIEKKMEKTYLKETSYYYKYKDNRANKEETLKIKKYFDERPNSLYSLIINKKINDKKDSWKDWEDFVKYKEIPEIKEGKKKIPSKNYSIIQIEKIFQKYKDNFTEVKIIQNLRYLEESSLLEKIMIIFYNKLYDLNKIKNKKNIDENDKLLVDNIKEIKKNYYYHFLNYFISVKNIQYAYLLMHRHFTYLREDETYKYYYHPFPYKETVDKVAKKFNINPIIILSIMEVESIFNSNAYSSAGAIGLMQIMPATGRAIAKELGIKDYDLYLPKYNIEFGGYYLSELLKRFHFQLPFSAASYNGGPHNMKRWLDDNKSKDLKLDEMIEEIGFRESRNYAKKIIKLFSIYNKTYFNEEQNIPVNVKYTDNKKIDF